MIGSSNKYDQPTYRRTEAERWGLAILTFIVILMFVAFLVWAVQFYPAVMAVIAIMIVVLGASWASIYAFYLAYE